MHDNQQWINDKQLFNDKYLTSQLAVNSIDHAIDLLAKESNTAPGSVPGTGGSRVGGGLWWLDGGRIVATVYNELVNNR